MSADDDERAVRERITEALRGYAPESVRAEVCGMAVRAMRAARPSADTETLPEPYPDDEDEQTCVNCSDEVLTLSSRGWCDGCEEDDAMAEVEQGPEPIDEEPPVDAPDVLREAIEELDRLGDEHWQQGDALNRVLDGFRMWATGRADELTVRHPCPYGCEGGHTDYEYGDTHRNPEGGY